MRRIIIISFLLVLSLSVFAQTAGDALRYSYWNYGGTARSMGVSGSMGALGGDYSSIITNPASIATFRRSELTFSPGVNVATVGANFNNTKFSDTRPTVNVNQIGLVFAKAKPNKWKTINFGIGYNRLADFSRQFNYSGTTNGSIADYFKELAQGKTPNELSDYDSGLAFDTYVIDTIGSLTQYANDFTFGDQTQKFQSVKESGSIGSLNISFGGNFDHKLYIGGSIGIPFVDYRLSKSYEESDVGDAIPFYEGIQFTEGLTTSGVGFNLNLGAIYRINQAVRIGAAIHTPTRLTLTDSYNSTINFDYKNSNGTGNFEGESPIGAFEYKLRTPWRFIGNAGFIIKKSGFISVEAEYVNYSKNKYDYDSEFADQETIQIETNTNNEINTTFQSGLNLRFGGEYVLKDFYRIRAGYALLGNPYANNSGMFDASQFSVGVGYRKNNYFFDIAYQRRMGEQTYAPYVLSSGLVDSPTVTNDLSTDYIFMTIGFKFGGKKPK